MVMARIACTSRPTALAAESAAELMPDAASLISDSRSPQPASNAHKHATHANFVIHLTSSPPSFASCYYYIIEKKNTKKGHEGGRL